VQYAAVHAAPAPVFAPELPLHIIQRGNDHQPILRGRGDPKFFRACLARAARDCRVAIHAYVFMANHVHLFATPMLAVSVPKVMQSTG
jgi:putative transposase